MRAIVLCIGLLLAGVGAWAAPPTALLVAGTVLVPGRAVATWLGATIAPDANNPQRVTLTRGATYLTVTLNTTQRETNAKLAAATMPAPACVLDGISYLPARTVGEVFGLTVAWDAAASTLTLRSADTPPLTFPVVPFPRPACVKDETLAGLTPGDRLAYAVALWGEGVKEEGESSLPGATDYTFKVDPAGGIALTVSVQDEAIVCISTYHGGDTENIEIAPQWLKKAGTGKRLTLTGDSLRIYGKASGGTTDPSGDFMCFQYPLGSLQLLCTYLVEGMVLDSITLAKKTVPLSQLTYIGE